MATTGKTDRVVICERCNCKHEPGELIFDNYYIRCDGCDGKALLNYTPSPSPLSSGSSSYAPPRQTTPGYSASAASASGPAEKGNVFAAILFGIASCIGIFFAAILVSTWLTGDWSIVITFLALIGGFIATFISLRNKKMPLFFLMLALSLVGYLNLFGIIPDLQSGAKTVQSASATITSGCNFRTGPSTNDAVIRSLSQGDKVKLTGEAQGGWTKVSHNGDTGWVSSEFLNK
ncbi:MAG: SH3 domain-containing protein [Treponema sp.]|nr:SH3 domain-containing protein [Treponema sp.]